MDINETDYLAHYGTPRQSGRYPWGSGGDETSAQRNKSFLDHVSGLKKQGMSETDIATGLGISTTQLRAQKAIAKNEHKQSEIGMAQRLKDKGYSNVAIGQRMGVPESSVRNYLSDGEKLKIDILQTTSAMLKDQVEQKGLVDIGTGVEAHLGISQTKLNTSVAMLQEEGYKVHYVPIEQLGTGNKTTIKVLSAPDVSYSDVHKNRGEIKQISEFSEDGGRSYDRIKPPVSISSKRVGITYAEEGGTEADGLIYIRPGVDDVSLGKSKYAQVRIAVDGTHYLKGMAVYKDDLPAGVDLVFNTNKKNTGNKLDAMKGMKLDEPDNPFGATITRQHGSLNIVNEEGTWDTWSRNLPSQFLSKQSPSLAKTQLDLTYKTRKDELSEIMTLTNPAVRRKLLEAYADGADSAAVHLKAAALPRQSTHVILPISALKDTEAYAPNFRNGEKVVLVRFPHGGIFEIPELTVNNNHPIAKKIMGSSTDAIGINAKVAERLSGADFDGDTVLVIPNNNQKVKTAPALAGLKNFDPQASYPAYEGMTVMSPQTKAKQMGVASNLITDMTIRGATQTELARAVRHSMVVIDAEKHKLNYKQSAIDNGIAALKAKYQGGKTSGASTLVSRASAEARPLARKDRAASDGGPIDRQTGKRIYVNTNESYVDKTGATVIKTIKSKQLAETDNAHTLSSGTTIERVYADHSNSLKGLANQARKALVETQSTPYSPSAKTAHAKEVTSLNAKLNLAIRNRPRERQAQVVANAAISAKRRANPDMDAATLKKEKARQLSEARARFGAKKQDIEISNAEWVAIQSGAITNNKLAQILDNADLDKVKQLATPKSRLLMTSSKTGRASAMLASGYTQAEVADALGVSLTTLKTAVGGGS